MKILKIPFLAVRPAMRMGYAIDQMGYCVRDNDSYAHGKFMRVGIPHGFQGRRFSRASYPKQIGTPALTVGDADATTNFDGIIKNTTGSLALTKMGTGILTLSGANTYCGDTTVNDGVLATSGASIPDIGKLVNNGGKVELTGSENVSYLFFGATAQALGTWGATDFQREIAASAGV